MPHTDTGADTPHEPLDRDNPEVAHEHSDVNVRAILGFIGVLIVSAIVIHVGLWLLFEYYERREAAQDPPRPPMATPGPAVPPAPRLQAFTNRPDAVEGLEIDPRVAMEQLEAAETAVLEGYRWVDRPGGIVTIPIERAMELVAERGLPPTAAPAEPPSTPAPTESSAPVAVPQP